MAVVVITYFIQFYCFAFICFSAISHPVQTHTNIIFISSFVAYTWALCGA